MPLSHRIERIAEQLREEVSQILATDVADPGVGPGHGQPRQGDARPVARPRLLDAARRRRRAQEAPTKALQRAAPFVRHVLADAAHAAPRARGALPVRRRAWPRMPASRRSCTRSTQEEAARDSAGQPRRARRAGRHRAPVVPARSPSTATCRGSIAAPRPIRRSLRHAPAMTRSAPDSPDLADVAARLHAARRVVVSSHERPDGDAIGSGMALVLALRALGKDARMVMCDAPPPTLQPFPGVDDAVDHRARSTETFDAAVIMECSDLTRTGVARPRPLAGPQHRPPSRQHALRRRELGRRIGGGLRRAGLRRSSGRSACRSPPRSPRTSTSRSSPTPGRSTSRT